MRIDSFWTHQVEDTGVVRRIYFIMHVVKNNQDEEWHYFGVTEAQRAIPDPGLSGTVYEHPYIQLPTDFDEITIDELEPLLYSMGQMIGIRKEDIGP